MKTLRNFVITSLILLTSVMAFANGTPESTQTKSGEAKWPTKAIQIMAAAKAGGVTDIHVRDIIAYWPKYLPGSTFAVVNQGNALVAYQQVKTAKPDGYMLLAQHDSFACTYATGATEINPAEDYEIVAVLEDLGINALIASPDAPYNTVPEMAAYAKAHPGEVSCAIATNGFTHFMWGAIQKKLGVRFKMVQAANGADKLTNVAGGFISLGNVDTVTAEQYEKAGKVKVIGVTAAASYKDPEGTPENWKSLQGQGIDLPFSSDIYLFAPKGTPVEVLEKMNSSLAEMIKDQGFIDAMAKLGSGTKCLSLADSKAYITNKTKEFVLIAEELGIKAK